MRRGIGWVMMLFITWNAWSQDHELKSTVEVYQDLQELQRGLRVLYLAAHPDDENTRLISWLENDQHIRTAYLSLTRGQGGQNLIGDEKGDALGVIRTHELLEARKVDGGEQFFTRAIDFGYSKSAEESFEFWGRDEILHDVVYVIRQYRPHVIIARFPPTRRAGHGHHEASAILAEEAFVLASDPGAYPDQVAKMGTWSTTALYHNSSSWWDKTLDEMTEEELAAKKIHRINIGVHNDLLGLGINEIASLARSKHRCQAFGTPRRRGVQSEYLTLVKGEWTDDFPVGLQGVWSQSPSHAEGIQRMIDAYEFTDRAKNRELMHQYITPLLAQRSMWAESRDMRYVQETVAEISRQLTGIRVEAYSDEAPSVLGSSYPVRIEVYNAGNEINKIKIGAPVDTSFEIGPSEMVELEAQMNAPDQASSPFWLRNPDEGWLYGIDKEKEIGVPYKEEVSLGYVISGKGMPINATTTVHRRWNDRSVGEIEEPLAFVPFVTLTPTVTSKVVRPGDEVELDVVLRAFESVNGLSVKVETGEGVELVEGDWPAEMAKGQERTVRLKFKINDLSSLSTVSFSATAEGRASDQAQLVIDYPHIPQQFIHTKASVNLQPLDLEFTKGKKILYVEGSGDEVDDLLEELGYTVYRTPLNELAPCELSGMDAIITGIRAFNRNEELAANMQVINEYVKQGGKLIMQYNTTYDLKVEQMGPYPLSLSRDRVTDENASVKLLKPKHPAFTTPNKMGDEDWNGWVQERGLYFAGEWDKAFEPLISWSDKGESAVNGGLVVADYGSGHVVYTGISFFRQLPAGVQGAYKLLVNLIEF